MKYRFLSFFLLITVLFSILTVQPAHAGGVVNAFNSFVGFIVRSSMFMVNLTIALFEIPLGIGGNHFLDSGLCRLHNLDESVLGFGGYSDDCTKDFLTILNGPGQEKICSNAVPVYFFNAPPVTGDEGDYNVIVYRFETPATTGDEALAYWFDGIKNQIGSGLYNGKPGTPKSADVLTNTPTGFFTNDYNNPTAAAATPLATFLYKDFCTEKGVCRFIDNTAPLDSVVAYAAKLERNYSGKNANIIWYPITVRSNGTAYISYNGGQIDVLDLGNNNYYLDHNGRRYNTVRSDISGIIPHLAIPDGELRGINVFYPFKTVNSKPAISFNNGYILPTVNATTYTVSCGGNTFTALTTAGGMYIPLGVLEACALIHYDFSVRSEINVPNQCYRGACGTHTEVTVPPLSYNDGTVMPKGVTTTAGFGRNAITTVSPPYTLTNKGETITATTGAQHCTNYQPPRSYGRGIPPPPIPGVTPEVPAPCTTSRTRAGTVENYKMMYQDYSFVLKENFLDGYDINYRGPGTYFSTGNDHGIWFPVWLNYNGGKLLFDDVRTFDQPWITPWYHSHYAGELFPNTWDIWGWPLGWCENPYGGEVCATLKSNENPPTQNFSGKFLSTKANEPALFPQSARGLHEVFVGRDWKGDKQYDSVWIPFFDPNASALGGPYQIDATLTCPPDTSVVVTSAQCTGVDLAVTVGNTTTSYDVLRNGQTIASDVPASQRSFHDGNTEPHMTYAYIIRAHTGTSTDDSAPATAYTKCLPTCTFKADPAKVIEHQASRLTWSCQEATACAITGGLTDIGSVAATGGTKSVTVNDKGTYNYTLTCQNVDGSVTLPSVVNVTKPGLQEIKP